MQQFQLEYGFAAFLLKHSLFKQDHLFCSVRGTKILILIGTNEIDFNKALLLWKTVFIKKLETNCFKIVQ